MAILAAPPNDATAVALPLIRMNQIDIIVEDTRPKEPWPIVLRAANPINSCHSVLTPLIQIQAKPISIHKTTSIFLEPILSNALPTKIMNKAAVKEPAVYIPENKVRDQFKSSIIGSKKIEDT